jgi:hypothetical protein
VGFGVARSLTSVSQCVAASSGCAPETASIISGSICESLKRANQIGVIDRTRDVPRSIAKLSR